LERQKQFPVKTMELVLSDGSFRQASVADT